MKASDFASLSPTTLSAIILLLMTIVGFFLRGLAKAVLTKLEEGNEKLSSIDKTMGIIENELKNQQNMINKQSEELMKIEKQNLKLREQNDGVIERIHQNELRLTRLEQKQDTAI